MGIEPVSLPNGAAIAGQVLDLRQVAEFFSPPGRTWVAPQTLASLGYHEGQQPRTEDGQRLPPLQARADMAPGLLLMDIGFAQPLLGQPGQLSRLLLAKDFAAQAPPLPTALAGQLVLRQGDAQGDLARLTESFHLNLDALGFLSFVVGLFIVHAAIGLALEQRRGLLRTCGPAGSAPDN
ncbi:hypothetical protein P308_11840 [Pseudomonas piscis]|nr:hypothetical protein P308_11840 [Pseudomonas piscis]